MDANNYRPPAFLRPPIIPRLGINGVYTNKMRYIKNYVLNVLAKRKFAKIFSKPMDLDKYPDYPNIVWWPMNLKTIRQRIRTKSYLTSDEVIADLYLIVDNNKEYFKLNDRMYLRCLKLEEFILMALMDLPEGEEKQVTECRSFEDESTDDARSVEADSEQSE